MRLFFAAALRHVVDADAAGFMLIDVIFAYVYAASCRCFMPLLLCC